MFEHLETNPHYVNRYLRFIKTKLERTIENHICEIHHIIPRCLGGNNAKSNLVKLTYREHYIAHLILSKCFFGPSKAKMIYALGAMNKSPSHLNRDVRRFNSRWYSYLRREFSKIESPLKGRPLSEETKKKISETRRAKNLTWTKEQRYKIISKLSGRKMNISDEERHRRRLTLESYTSNNPHPRIGTVHSNETKLKLSKSASKRIRSPHSEETKKKMSKSNISRRKSEEWTLLELKAPEKFREALAKTGSKRKRVPEEYLFILQK